MESDDLADCKDWCIEFYDDFLADDDGERSTLRQQCHKDLMKQGFEKLRGELQKLKLQEISILDLLGLEWLEKFLEVRAQSLPFSLHARQESALDACR